MSEYNWCITPFGYDVHVLPSGSTIYTGTIPLTQETNNPSVSHSDAITELVLEDGKRYAFFTTDPHHVFTAACHASEGSIVIGPIPLGGIFFTITCSGSSSTIDISNGVMVGDQYASAPEELNLHVEEIYGSGGSPDNAVIDIELSASRHMIVTYADGSMKDLGNVGSPSVVYVPHIDEHHILTWTIEDSDEGIPDPVDLNPWDEWSAVSQADQNSEYDWDGI